MICGFFAQADMHGGKGFFGLHLGLDINQEDWTVEEPRFGLSYGGPLNIQENYFGFFELGIHNPTLLLSLKYGYELMRESTVSFGAEISLLLGLPSYDVEYPEYQDLPEDCRDNPKSPKCQLQEAKRDKELEDYEKKTEALGFANELGVFIKIKIANSVSTFVRAGIQQTRPFKDAGDLKFSPYADVGVKYHL